jgi:hypothetical protein
VRQDCLWGTLLAGGAGVEWYCGYRYPHNDLNLDDFRSRDTWWKQSTLATRFIQQFPLEEMKCSDELVNNKGAFCLEKPGEIYLAYLPAGTQNAKINLSGDKTFSIKWFNPREGGEMLAGTVETVQGKGFQSVGIPPTENEKDWVVVLQ